MAEGTPDLSGLLSGLLSNPAALSSVLGLLGNLGGGEKHPPQNEEKKEIPKDEGGEVLSLPAFATHGAHGERRRGKHERECLIGALSPYLSPERRRAAEGACKLLEVLELFEGRR